MARSAVSLLLLTLAAAACTPGENRPMRDPTQPGLAQAQARAAQHADAVAKAEARLAREQAACRKGNRRACARATAAEAVLADLNRPAL